MDLIAVCPKLIAINADGTCYRGLITADKQDFLIEIKFDKAGDLSTVQLNGEWKLCEILHQHADIINQRLNQCTTLAMFVLELRNILESELRSRQQTSRIVPLPHFYTRLVADIERVGWSRVSFIATSFRELHLVTTDIKQRKHIVKLLLDEQYPAKCPTVTCDLPAPVDVQWTLQSSLADVYNKFVDAVARWQLFWDCVQVLDKNTCVLEPEKPTASATYRRLAVGKNASVRVDIDPYQPRNVPNCYFLGSDQIVGPLQENLNKNLSLWNVNDCLLNNLERVLDMKLPSPTTASKQDLTAECGICYAYRLNNELPTEACDDVRCAQTFHNSCLCEWLRSLPSTRQSFNVLFGECPYCNKPITVKVELR